MSNQEYNRVQPGWTLHIPMWVIHELKLKGAERDVYSAIYSFTFDGGWKQLEWEFLADFTGTSKTTVRRVADDLAAKGLLEKSTVYTKWGERNQFRAICPEGVGVSIMEGCSKSTPIQSGQGGLSNMDRVAIQSGHHKLNNHLIDNLIEKHTQHPQGAAETPEQKPTYTADAVSVCDEEWNEFKRIYPKPVPTRDEKKARKAFDAVLQEKGMVYIRNQVAAYVSWEQAQGKEERYWKNGGAWLIEGWVTKDYPESTLKKVLRQSDNSEEADPEAVAELRARLKAKYGKEDKPQAVETEGYEHKDYSDLPDSISCTKCGAVSHRMRTSPVYVCSRCGAYEDRSA